MLIKKPEKANPWFRIFDFYPGLKDGYRAQSIHTGWVDVHTPSAQRVKGRLSVPRGLPGRIGDEAFVATDRYTLWQGDEVSQMINELWDQSVLLYIHGFNNDFSEAVTRAAQLKVDLAWDGAVVAVDWPSAGMGGAYAIDRQVAESDKLAHQTMGWLLTRISQESPIEGRHQSQRGSRHILCHSMGNEIFNRTTAHLEEQKTLSQAMFDHIIFAAPDVYVGDFKKLVSRLRQHNVASNYTLYYSRKDAAVNISRFVNFLQISNLVQPSAIREFISGRAGVTPHHYPGIDMINADLVNGPHLAGFFTDFRHGYFASSDRVLQDIHLLVKQKLPAQSRHATLLPQKNFQADAAHYVLRP